MSKHKQCKVITYRGTVSFAGLSAFLLYVHIRSTSDESSNDEQLLGEILQVLVLQCIKLEPGNILETLEFEKLMVTPLMVELVNKPTSIFVYDLKKALSQKAGAIVICGHSIAVIQSTDMKPKMAIPCRRHVLPGI